MKRLFPIVLLVLIIFPLADVQAQDDLIILQFTGAVGDEVFSCGTVYEGLGAEETATEFMDFRFYVHDIRLINAGGEEVPVELMQDGVWQVENVALLDFEDGSGRCDVGNQAINATVEGMVPAGEYTGVVFKMGVPFELNHNDTTLAPSPLNLTGMWWNWQTGYKFIRVDMLAGEEDPIPWNIHLGSTGCDSPAAVVPPEDVCSRLNVMEVRLDEFDLENDVIVADLAGLLEDVNLVESDPMPPGCQAGFDDPDCPQLFPNFGLDLETGECLEGDCSGQTLFRVAARENVTIIEDVDVMSDMDMEGHTEDHSQHSN
ncbi:MAG: metallo-mystery pair system four-Cys motif protein [Chloroflexi bacterium]|nr:metallo-mystery pair system four-Cys motif protein [Chloroflexota bacterium]